MADTCTRLGGAQERPGCKPRPLLLVPGLGPLSERYEACRGQMLLVLRDFRKNLKNNPRQAIFMEKPLERAWVCLMFGWDKAIGYHQSGKNSVMHFDGVSDMVPAC